MKIQNKSYLVNACTMLIGIGLQSMEHNIPGIIMISVGIIGIFATVTHSRWRQWKNKKTINNDELTQKPIAEELEKRPNEAVAPKFPDVPWLTAKDVMKIYGFSIDILKQHIENGLPGYIKNPENQDLRQIKKDRDLIALEVWSDESDSMVELWRFKTEDVEKYIKKVVWLTGKEVIDKHNISAIELYQHIKNGLNIYPKDFSTVMLTDHVQPLSKYDIGFEIEYDMAHSDEVYNILKNYHFKVCDIEKYIRANKIT